MSQRAPRAPCAACGYLRSGTGAIPRREGDRLDVQEQAPIHETVRAEPALELDALAADPDPPFKSESPQRQPIAAAGFIDRVQQTRPRPTMHRDGQPDRPLGQAARQRPPLPAPCRPVIRCALRVEGLLARESAPRQDDAAHRAV